MMNNEGNIIICPAGEYGIIAEKRGNNLVIIKSKEDGTPYLDYIKADLVRPVPENYESDDRLNHFYDYYTIAKTHSQSYLKVQKARSKKYIRRWKGKDGKWHYLYKEPEKKQFGIPKYKNFSGGVDQIIQKNNMDFELFGLHFSSDKINDFSITNRGAVYFFEHPKEEKSYSDFPLESFKKQDKDFMVEEETDYDPLSHVGWYYGDYANLVKLKSNSDKVLDLRNENNYEWLVKNIDEFKNLDIEDDESEIEELIENFYDQEQEIKINNIAKKHGYDIVLYSDSSEGSPFTSIAVVNPDIIMTQIKKAGYGTVTGSVNSPVPMKSNLVPKRVTIRGKDKSYSAIRWVRVKAPKVKQRKQSEDRRTEYTPKQRLAQAWKEQLTPGVEEYKAIVSGDRDIMGKFVMKALWEKGVGQVETIKTVSLTDVVNDTAKKITGVRPEGFEPSDIMQEVAMRLMEMQYSGKFANNQVPREKFASFLAQTVRNTSLEILRKQRLDKYAEKDINDMADMIADARQEPIDEKMETAQAVEKITDTIKKTYSKLPTNQKIVLNKVLNGKSHLEIAKELRITPDSVKGLAKRAYGNIVANLKRVGIKIPADAKGVTKEIKAVLLREYGVPDNSKKFKARIKLSNGKLFLKGKPAQVGETRVHGGIKVKKVAPGKWEPVGGTKEWNQKPAESDKDKKFKKIDVKEAKKGTREKMKTAIKDAIKGFVETMSDVFMGRGGTETAATETQKTGESIKSIGQSKEVEKKKKKRISSNVRFK